MRRYASFAIAPSRERLLREPMDTQHQQHGIHVLLARDADGGVIVGDSHQYSGDGVDLDERVDAGIETAILEYARGMARLPTWEIAARWYGIYPYHPADEVLQETIEERIHIVTDLRGRGMTCGPALAREKIESLG